MEISESFPRAPWPASLSGAQPKLTIQFNFDLNRCLWKRMKSKVPARKPVGSECYEARQDVVFISEFNAATITNIKGWA